MCAKSENPSFQRRIAGMQAVVMVDLLHHMARIMAIRMKITENMRKNSAKHTK